MFGFGFGFWELSGLLHGKLGEQSIAVGQGWVKERQRKEAEEGREELRWERKKKIKAKVAWGSCGVSW